MSKTKNELYRTLDGAEPEGERYSELLEQCRIWNERDEYQKIIDALEAIPDQARTPETDSELARAYNNLADPGEPRGISMIRRALALLKPHEAYFEGDHVWNFRMGYSYYHLDQEGRGLFYFRRALEALPGDKDTEELIGCCEDRITLPRFRENFRERTQKTWAAFAEQEAELRRFMEEDSLRREIRSNSLNWFIFKSMRLQRYWSTGISWWAVSLRRTWACAPANGRFPGTMCGSGWNRQGRKALPSLHTAKSCCPCFRRRKAGHGGC